MFVHLRITKCIVLPMGVLVDIAPEQMESLVVNGDSYSLRKQCGDRMTQTTVLVLQLVDLFHYYKGGRIQWREFVELSMNTTHALCLLGQATKYHALLKFVGLVQGIINVILGRVGYWYQVASNTCELWSTMPLSILEKYTRSIERARASALYTLIEERLDEVSEDDLDDLDEDDHY